MISAEFTDVEKRFIEGWYNNSEIKYDVNYEDPDSVNIGFIRDLMRETAYHEAGHLVARMFTDFELSHARSLSIIPDNKSNGRVRIERAYSELLLNQVPMQMQRSQGYSLLVILFAGYGSVMIMEQSECNSLWEYLNYEQCIDEDFYEKGADLCRADRIASILSRRYFSKDRILGMTAQWTLEMLRIPAIWKAVEAIAAMLTSKGEITAAGNADIFCDIRKELNVPRVTKIPKWSRRIYGK